MKKGVIGLILIFSLLLIVPTILAQTGQADVDFYTSGWYCERTDTTAAWVFLDGEQQREWVVGGDGDGTGCFDHSLDWNNRSCCPNDVVCSGDGSGVCEGEAQYCWQLTPYGEDACENAGPEIGERSVEYHKQDTEWCGQELLARNIKWDGKDCKNLFNVTTCQCKWNEVEEQCVANSYTGLYCQEDDGTQSKGSKDYCWWVVTNIDDRCNTTQNNIVVTTQAKWHNMDTSEAPPGCEDDVRTYNCPSGAALPFLPFYGIFLSSILIAGIYAFILRKKY